MAFEITHRDSKTRARTGILTAPNGARVETPSYVVVGTHAEVRCLKPQDLKDTGTQMIISNTFHLWQDLGENIGEFPGLHKALDFNGFIMTDSGGYQVFSLGFGLEYQSGKIFPDETLVKKSNAKNLVRIGWSGAKFFWNGFWQFLGPKESIAVQEKLGADGILSFDECTPAQKGYFYNLISLWRTHRWAKKCLQFKTNPNQILYGIIQGSTYKSLRIRAAKFIAAQPFGAFAVGGSLGKSRADMRRILDWVMPLLPQGKPVHLLGIGKPEDLFDGVGRGIDTFDCVIPTREARHGRIWTSFGPLDIKKAAYAADGGNLDEDFICPILARDNIRRQDLHRLFKAKDQRAGYYATAHNVFFFNKLMEKIRESIRAGRFSEFKEEFLLGLQKK